MSRCGERSAGNARGAPRGGAYRPRNPRASPLWQCARRHAKELRDAGRLRRAVEEQAIERFIECGDPHHGFARIYSDACATAYLLAYTCQTPEVWPEQDRAGAGAGCRLGVRIDEQARGDAAKLAEPRPAPADRIGRSSRGRVNTYCRCGTGARTFCSTQSPYRSTRFWWQLGQKYRVLHEYASR